MVNPYKNHYSIRQVVGWLHVSQRDEEVAREVTDRLTHHKPETDARTLDLVRRAAIACHHHNIREYREVMGACTVRPCTCEHCQDTEE